MLPFIDDGLLGSIIAVQTVLFVVGVSMVAGHGVWLHLTGLRRDARLERARVALHSALEGRELSDAEMAEITGLSLERQVRLLGDVAANVVGGVRERLLGVARDAGMLAAAEAACRSRMWWRRLRGARLFTIFGGGEAVMPSLLLDRRLDVRTEAAGWAVGHPTPEVLDRLTAMFEDREALSLFNAQDALVRIGPPARSAVLRRLEGGAGRSLVPALEVAAGLGDECFLAPALVLSGHDSAPVRAGAARVLSVIGGAAAVERLLQMLDDTEDEVASAAARALGTLGHWPAAGALASLLRHPAWVVRQQAGVALRSLGAPGLLFLRRSVSDPDPFAADMARHVLDLPDSAVRALAS